MKRGFGVGMAAVLIAAAYCYSRLKIGWIAGDDGTLAQSALRVLGGELPHRDFAEIYTGGLSFYHALAFRLFGVNLVAMRYAAFAVFVPWTAAVYYIASRMAKPLPAAAITLLCAAWSLPTYPTPMPSWYNLFLATFGAAAIFRFMQTRRRYWLFLAGVCGGLSCLVKIVGLYYVAAVLLFLVFFAQTSEPRREANSPWLYRVFVLAGLIGFLACELVLIRRLTLEDFLHFLLPSLALVGLLLWLQWKDGATASSRFRELFALAVPFAAGLAVPVAVFLLPYWKTGSLRAVYRGVFVGGAAAASALSVMPPFPPLAYLTVAPAAVVVAVALTRRRELPRATYYVGLAAIAVILVGSRLSYGLGVGLWISAQMVVPPLVLFAVFVLVAQPEFVQPMSHLRQQQIFLLIALATVCSLVQFPFAAPIYFCYVAPLVALAAFAILTGTHHRYGDALLGGVMLFYMLFAVVYVVPLTIYHFNFSSEQPTSSLPLPRVGGLRVPEAKVFEQLTQDVQLHAEGGPIVAGPASPEVYFLTGLQNATHNDIGLAEAQVERAMQDPAVKVMVVNQRPFFAVSKPSAALSRLIEERFPNSERIDKYEVRWR